MPDGEEELERFCHQVHHSVNKVKQKVRRLEQVMLDDIQKLSDLNDIYNSHALKFVQAEDQLNELLVFKVQSNVV